VADPDEIGLTVVAIDGIAVALTLSELDRRANQWGRALMDAGTAATKVNRSAMIEVRGG
jgi:hypothetical protein